MNSSYTLFLALAVATALVGCGDLEAEGAPSIDGGAPGALIDAGGTSIDGGDTAAAPSVDVSRQLDTSSSDVWVYLDLETGESRTEAAPPVWPAWDLKLQRFKVALNGGAGGPGTVQVLAVQSSFAALVKAPRDGYTTDGPDGADTDLEPDYAISSGASVWYDYNGTNHTLSPKVDLTYVVKTTEGGFFKVAVGGYYNAAGSPGYMQLHWASVVAPDGAIVSLNPVVPDAGVDATSGASKM